MEEFYILATSRRTGGQPRVLKHADTFAVFDQLGDVPADELGYEGLYHEGTRFISKACLSLGGKQPLLLSSNLAEDNVTLDVDMTNADLYEGDDILIPRGTLHIRRKKLLWDAGCFELIQVSNYGFTLIDTALTFDLDADFVDVFEVRGAHRPRRGETLPGRATDRRLDLSYRGLDEEVRTVSITWDRDPEEVTEKRINFRMRVEPGATQTLHLTTSCHVGLELTGTMAAAAKDATAAEAGATSVPTTFEVALAQSRLDLGRARAFDATITASNTRFTDWVHRSIADLHSMVTDFPTGPYPYAGIPWFSTPFGRDGIITALQTLWLNPEIARGVLGFLAATQATELDPEHDSEPGKILHEMRKGEMAALGEVPFGRYYGSVDATPLFILLAARYLMRTGDIGFIQSIWPNMEAALSWIDKYGDLDGDGFVEYRGNSERGLVQQGWKDSWDSVPHADGTLAEGPIALCEVQGYVYAAKIHAAEIAHRLGDNRRGLELRKQATALREKFQRAFWSDDLSTYVLALDGEKRACDVRSSNAGHTLFSGIASREHAALLADVLFEDAFFSGWGIRTLAATEARFNPMSYHNGSVWPHDNAMIAMGLAQYSFKRHALRILDGLFDASLYFDQKRMPELFCGFGRRPAEGPTLYPVACLPQAWSAGSVFMLLQATLGIAITASERRIDFRRPVMPGFLSELTIEGLRVGDASVDLCLRRHDEDVAINVLRRDGQVDIAMLK